MTTVWFNGDWLEAGAMVDCRDRGFLLGDGAFETLLARDGKPAFLGAHIARLRCGLETLRIPAPDALGDLDEILIALAARNAMHGLSVARVTITRGPGARGLAIDPDPRPSMLVSVSPAPPLHRAAIRLRFSSRRRHSDAVNAAFKATGGYLENMLAHDEVRRAGADEALMVNENGRLVCAAAANVFFIDPDGVAVTPPVSEGAMPGVVRGLLLGGDHGVAVDERPIAREDLSDASLFLTNSILGVAPAVLSDEQHDMSEALQCLQSWYQARLEAAFER